MVLVGMICPFPPLFFNHPSILGESNFTSPVFRIFNPLINLNILGREFPTNSWHLCPKKKARNFGEATFLVSRPFFFGWGRSGRRCFFS